MFARRRTDAWLMVDCVRLSRSAARWKPRISHGNKGTQQLEIQRVGWVERSDTHHVRDDRDGFREALNPSYDRLPDGLFDLPDGQISKNLSSPF